MRAFFALLIGSIALTSSRAAAEEPDCVGEVCRDDADGDEPVIEAAPIPDPLEGLTIQSRAERRADLVVLVSIDGLRADASRRMPTLERLRREGMDATNAWTIERSATLPSHGAMLTGVDIDRHGLQYNGFRRSQGLVRFPTVFRVARRAGLATAMYVGKPKFRHLAEPDGAAVFDFSPRGCGEIVTRARAALRSQRDGVLFLHFTNTDAAGHRHGWMTRRYFDAVSVVDACLSEVVATIRDRSRDAGRTLLLVTSDHGGHGRSHGSRAEVDRRIPWVAWGPGIPRRRTMPSQVSTLDTAATVLDALGLPQTPGIVGRPIAGLWADAASSGSAANGRPTKQRRARPRPRRR